jgi:N-methylhydantoinase A
VPLPSSGGTAGDARKGTRTVDYATDGVHEAAIYDGDRLEPGMRFDGPAIVETSGSTVVVGPGDALEVDRYGNLVIAIGAPAGRGEAR